MNFARHCKTQLPEELEEHKPCVVLIDDHAQSRMVGKKHLNRDGFDVIEFGSGGQFLAALPKITPDIILLDVMMPEMSGYTVCRLLRSQENYKTVPILMLTGLDDMDSISEAYDVGATDFVTKPINWTILQHRLRYMLRAGIVMRNLNSTIGDLNDSRFRLAQAQKIAKLGHWQLDVATGEMFWSDQIYQILFAEHLETGPTLARLMDALAAKSRIQLTEVINKMNPSEPSCTIELQVQAGGKSRYVQFECRLDLENTQMQLLHGTIQDITDRKATEHEIWRKAYYDSLTLLPNRQYLLETLEAEIYRANTRQEQFAFLLMDFQRFRAINQTFGHVVGDHLLQSIAQRLEMSQRVQSGIFLARVGGDQFAIVLSRMKRTEEIEAFAETLIKAVQKPYYHQQYELNTQINIGICHFPNDASNVDELFKHAHGALEQSKKSVGKNYLFYNSNLTFSAIKRVKIEQMLRSGVANSEFYLCYQPKLDLVTGKIAGAEALVRWVNPEFGEIPPSEFIPIAEDAGLINELGNWVLEQACAEVKPWLEQCPEFNLAVNISGQQFYQSNLVELIVRVLTKLNFPAKNLELEITESVVMQDIENTKLQLVKLLSYGISSTIDDFGTGYSSLNYLKCLPTSKLKIDKSFVTDVATNTDSRAIVKAIISMAHNLNLQVVAEGVETAEQKQFCVANECDFIQGYLVGKPVRCGDFVSLIL